MTFAYWTLERKELKTQTSLHFHPIPASLTEATGSIMCDSVSPILPPSSSSTCKSSNSVGFSRWSGCDGYPGAGRMPWYLTYTGNPELH